MFYYYDTCAIAKAFHTEIGSDVVLKLLETDSGSAFVSELVFPEFYSTTFKKLRSLEISNRAISLKVCQNFEVAMQYFNVVELNSAIYTEGKSLIGKWGSKYDIKTLDSLHLAIFIHLATLKEMTLVSADRKLCNLAIQLGFEVINPESGQKETTIS